MRVAIRGIYTTALTRLFSEAGHEVVQATAPIEERFEREFSDGPADLACETSRDRQGVSLSGVPEAVEEAKRLLAVGRDAFIWEDPTPLGAVFEGRVEGTRGGGAVVSLPEGRGYLPFDDAEGYVEAGDELRVQVTELAAPWDEDDPRLTTTIRARTPGGLAALEKGQSGIDAPDAETAGLVDLLSVEIPEEWGVSLGRRARGASLDDLNEALSRVTTLAEEYGDGGANPYASAWCWFGRESRFSLDGVRREITATMAGHHRIKAGSNRASDAVDFAEALCEPTAFPFDAVASQFGPRAGDELAIEHGKPGGRVITLGRGEVIEYDPEGSITLRREMTPGGSYDALGTSRESGDVAITTLKEGRWWYPTVYRDDDGESKGTYVNVCTPVELFPTSARYVDLHVDVIKHPDGRVERVDDDELAEAVGAGLVGEELAEKARGVAAAIERALD
ncbi:DUF402 domain-containing protein [Halalkalicoccus jeotgali]|uniref:Probable ribonuclease FAU-1 n=1 Tax=Halalkalicoccus jeotgali (strain DSM 18796 / CECT 7217 / JCM 14584 / KCTC 4019 / B3) TaxID=795797 RepID=D8J7S0_HALJB|nr:DUF402 domain-containing protein [Halalkalicoccus jeotgali]ADJ16090.1 Predicted ribonuclease of the G/E family protein [Halalkalicoccus jeotgali B3]ELY38185.1 putative ribonuclease of the G/E family protein [Halalkalicoccus jeotgali B3]